MSEQVVDAPTWEIVDNAVRQLNGREVNDVYLRSDNGWWLGICGGSEDFFVSVNNEDIGEYWVVSTPAPADQTFEVMCGGQSASFSASQRASLTDALVAAKAFLASSGRAEDLTWVRS